MRFWRSADGALNCSALRRDTHGSIAIHCLDIDDSVPDFYVGADAQILTRCMERARNGTHITQRRAGGEAILIASMTAHTKEQYERAMLRAIGVKE